MSEPDKGEAEVAMPTDQRVFIAVITLGVVAFAVVMGLLLRRDRRDREASVAPARLNADATTSTSRQLIDFALTDRTGRAVTRAELQGKFLVVNFVFASCSLSCLQVIHHMAAIERFVSGQEDVRLLSFTMDPQSDTPGVLAKFARQFTPDTNRWLFLTGEKRALYSLLEQSFLGPADPKLAGTTPGGFPHFERIALVDSRGKVRAMFNGLKPSVTNEVIAMLKRLRSEPRTP